MTVRNVLAGAAAISLAAAPVVAQAPAAAPVVDSSELGGRDGTGYIIALLAVAAIIVGIIVSEGTDDDVPVSS